MPGVQLAQHFQSASVTARLSCDDGLHRHVPLRIRSVPVAGGVHVLGDTVM